MPTKLLISSLITLLLSFSALGGENKIYSFISDPFLPYVIGQEGDRGKISGIVPWYLEELMKRIDLGTPYFEIMPWQRCMREVKEGHYDAIMQMRYSEERAKIYLFTEPYIKSKFKLYYSKKRFPTPIKFETLSDLTPYQILATEGYSYGEAVAQAEKEGKLILNRTIFNEKNIELLQKNRADFFLSDSIVAEYYIEKFKLQNEVSSLDKDLGISIYHIAISKSSPLAKHLEQINKQIKAMEKDRVINSFSHFGSNQSENK